MKMSNLKYNTDTDDAIEALQKRNAQYFVNNKISDEQIESKKQVLGFSVN